MEQFLKTAGGYAMETLMNPAFAHALVGLVYEWMNVQLMMRPRLLC